VGVAPLGGAWTLPGSMTHGAEVLAAAQIHQRKRAGMGADSGDLTSAYRKTISNVFHLEPFFMMRISFQFSCAYLMTSALIGGKRFCLRD